MKQIKNVERNLYHSHTDFGFLFFEPDEAPLIAADDDGALTGCACNIGAGATTDREGNDWDVFCLFRDAETVGLGIES